MSESLEQLLELLRLEQLEVNLFRGQSQNLGWGTVFGGQVLGQALSAAAQTVPPERTVHSLHGYFLRPGDVAYPIVYDVDRIRDGKSFTTRRVVAIQKGRPIFSLAASFQIAEPGLSHQAEKPDVPEPEELPTEQERNREFAHLLPPHLAERLTQERPIEVRSATPSNPLRPVKAPPRRQVWYRVPRTLPDDPALHCYLLAYASDFQLLGTCLLPHGVSWMTPGMQIASLDHAMWFHRPFRMDDWLLYDMDSPCTSGGRGLVRGRFFTRDGQLVASTTQEGLIRQRQPRSGSTE